MKVLVVDDSKLIRHTITGMLVKNFNLESIQVDSVDDGDTALDYIQEHNPTIILLDIMMQRVGGIEVLKALYERTMKGEHQIIMITGMDDANTLRTCFQLGAKDFIQKPINEVELIARIEGALRISNLINDLKWTQRSITEKNKQLNHINNQLLEAKNQMVQSEKLAAIGHLAAGIAHEINNPVGFISSNLSTLKSYFKSCLEFFKSQDTSLMDPIQRKNIEIIVDDIPSLFEDTDIGIVRIKEIVNSLRSFARIDKVGEFEDFDINQGLKDTLVVSKHRYRYVSEVETSFEDLPMISAHGGKLNQVFMNLIVNAADAITEAKEEDNRNGLIRVKTAYDKAKNEVVIKVEDNGIGMDQDKVADIFNPFFTTKPVGSGTGLGLSVSYDIIVNEHKGHISATSQKGLGTCFTICLPVDQDVHESTISEEF